MNSKRFLMGLLKILGQISTTIMLLASATVLYVVSSSTGLLSSEARIGWLVIGAAGLAVSLWASIGTGYYERFAESSKLSKLMALISATAGVLLIAWLIVTRPQ
ncbi:MAG: hypothetical protein RMN52_05645 [Anaerolineae bacterium]|nr:hypothetical protein [Candidatus Roseilinea sp.]MDW8449468.1 hypothetical protein [Anaerolineae bacterium]